MKVINLTNETLELGLKSLQNPLAKMKYFQVSTEFKEKISYFENVILINHIESYSQSRFQNKVIHKTHL